MENPSIISKDASSLLREVFVNDCNGIEFDGPLFRGKIIVLIRGIKEPSASPYFTDDKQRTTAVFVQGFFKKKIEYQQLLTGQCFQKKLKLGVPKILVQTVLGFLKKIAPLLKTRLYVDKPFLLTPICCSAQLIHMAAPGETPPDISAAARGEILDDELENLIPGLTAQRRRHFRQKSIWRENTTILEARIHLRSTSTSLIPQHCLRICPLVTIGWTEF